MSNLEIHAENEMRRAGLFDKDSDYEGMLGPSVMKLIRVFAEEGHSGMSAHIALQIFNRVAQFKTLTPITNDPTEWVNVSEYGGPEDKPIWQNNRDGTNFSHDGGNTGYSIDDKERKVVVFPSPEKE